MGRAGSARTDRGAAVSGTARVRSAGALVRAWAPAFVLAGVLTGCSAGASSDAPTVTPSPGASPGTASAPAPAASSPGPSAAPPGPSAGPVPDAARDAAPDGAPGGGTSAPEPASSPTPEPVAPDGAGTPGVSAVLVTATVDPSARVVQLSGLVTGVVVDGGTCRYELRRDGQERTVTTQSVADANGTSCPWGEVPLDEVTPGTWQARLSYPAERVSSQWLPVTVP